MHSHNHHLILKAAEQLCGSRQQAHAWYHHEKIATFGGATPHQLVDNGREADLLRYLQSLQGGAAG